MEFDSIKNIGFFILLSIFALTPAPIRAYPAYPRLSALTPAYSRLLPLTLAHADAKISTAEWQKPEYPL